MPRYLTPTKICLLALVDLYIADQIPTSAELNVLSFVASRINIPSEHDQPSLEERFKLSTFDLATLSEALSQWPSGIPGRSIYDALLQRLWELDGLDSLHILFQHLGGLVAPAVPVDSQGGSNVAKISRSSPLGQFIRRCCVEFTRLHFDDSKALWSFFAAYRASSHETWALRNPTAAKNLGGDQPAWAGSQFEEVDQSLPNNASAEDSDTLLSISVHQLQKMGTRVPEGVRSRLQQWIGDQSDSSAQSLQYFMAFFEHWRAGQYTMALESLHRYFDYSLIAKGGSDNLKVYYQYALLHLSVLHADFECWKESVDAMEECIATGKLVFCSVSHASRDASLTLCLNGRLSAVGTYSVPASAPSPFA